MKRLVLALLLAGCDSTTEPQVLMSFSRAHGLYDAPFPSDDLRRADGTIKLDQVPNPDNIDLINQGLALLKTQPGFATSAHVFFQTSAPLDVTKLPDLATSITDASPVFLVAVDDGAPDLMKRRPITVSFSTDGGPFGAPNLLALIPLQGVPLRPNATYAAVVTRKVVDAKGHPLAQAAALGQLIGGATPAGMSADAFATYRRAITALTAGGVKMSDVAALTVFTTGAPTVEMQKVIADMLSRPLPSPDPFLPTESFNDFCVRSSQAAMYDYQQGTTPFETMGGGWQFDGDGKPILQHMTPSRIFVTVPNRPMPPAGFPVVVFVRVGGGPDNVIAHRGVCATEEFTEEITPGTGPGMYFAQHGFAAIQIDGPVGGLRNPSGDINAEALLIFNYNNAAALRDNVRETAAELALLAHMLPGMSMAPCMGQTGTVKFDTSHVAIMGHSNGAWVAPLAAAFEPMFGAMILSGGGGSYVANMIDKQKPLKVKPLAEIILNYNQRQRDLFADDPALLLVQWALESSDPQVYDSRILADPPASGQPRHVLMLQGIVDHYILPSIANSTSLPMGLDLAGPALDGMNAEEQMLGMTSVATLLPYVGRKAITLPASANQASGLATAVVVQHNGDAIEDGHEVVFQTDPPKHQYGCFLESWAKGVPVVPPDGAAGDPCN